MVIFRDVRQYKCSECKRWFNDSDRTHYFKIFDVSGQPEIVAVFCSATCKEKFLINTFSIANNPSFKEAVC